MHSCQSLSLVSLALLAALAAAPAAAQSESTMSKTMSTAVDAAEEGAGVAMIDRYRERVEAGWEDLERVEVDLGDARPQVQQKWRLMHAYMHDGDVVRIKLYPHEGVSERSEEFYYRDGNLVLAFVEDEGASSRGPAEDRSGKTYYFARGRLIGERNKTGEPEITDSAADAARLLQEAKEYMNLARG